MEHDGCVGCKYERDSVDSKYCLGCKQNAIDKYVPMTNADIIRSMTDEELARFFDCGLGDVSINFHCEECDNHLNCDVCYLEWLQSEVK